MEEIARRLDAIKENAFEIDLQLDDLYTRGPLSPMDQADSVVADCLSAFHITVVSEKASCSSPILSRSRRRRSSARMKG